jgi:hypothetical protein
MSIVQVARLQSHETIVNFIVNLSLAPWNPYHLVTHSWKCFSSSLFSPATVTPLNKEAAT